MFNISDVIAVAGLALGLFNSWWMFHSGRLRLKIVPCISLPLPDSIFTRVEENFLIRMPSDVRANFASNGILSLRIINKSSFPVDIVQCGFAQKKDLFYPRKTLLLPFAYSVPNDVDVNGDGRVRYPIKLQSREAIVLVDGDLSLTLKHVMEKGYKYVYAETACGVTCYKELHSILSALKVSPRT